MSEPTILNPDEIIVPEQELKISDELKIKVHSIRAFAECHNIMSLGQYRASDFQGVSVALTFLRSCHAEAVEQACKDKGAWLVPELKEFLEKKKEAENAKS